MKRAIRVELPSATAQRQSAKPVSIALSVDAQGCYSWNLNPVGEQERGRLLGAQARQAGLHKIGCVTEPQH